MLKYFCFYIYFICIISPLETSPDLRCLAADVVLADRIRHRFWSHASQSADVVLNLMAGSTLPCRCFVCFPRRPPRSSSTDISFLLSRPPSVPATQRIRDYSIQGSKVTQLLLYLWMVQSTLIDVFGWYKSVLSCVLWIIYWNLFDR